MPSSPGREIDVEENLILPIVVECEPVTLSHTVLCRCRVVKAPLSELRDCKGIPLLVPALYPLSYERGHFPELGRVGLQVVTDPLPLRRPRPKGLSK